MNTVLVGSQLEENLALAYLKSSLLRAGHECSIIPFNRQSELSRVARKILHHRADLIGFSLVAQRRYDDFRYLARLIRQHGFGGHITAGGHFASLRAGEILVDAPDLDSVIHHDGEERIVALTKWRGFTGEPPQDLDGITWRTPGHDIRHRPPKRVVDIDTLPFPARQKPDRTLGFAKASIVSSRGCSGSCSFCSIHAWHRQVPSGRLRFRFPANVSEEMIALHRDHNVRVFVFHDDDFIHPDRKEALKRCRLILEKAEREMGVPMAFVIKCRPDNVDKELFCYLKSKGLVRVYVGIESNSEAGIKTLNRKTTAEINKRALEILGNLDIFACFNLLIFHPASTVEEIQENLKFLECYIDHPFDIARVELYARSSLEERMVSEGRAMGDFRGYDYRIQDMTAEAAFRLFADLLWERHFGARSILQRAQDLGYRLSLLKRFYPELSSPDLQISVESLIREVNSDTIGYLRRLLAAAISARGRVERGDYGLIPRDMPREVAARIRQQSGKLAALSFELELRAMLGRSGVMRVRRSVEWPRIIGRLARAIPPAALFLNAFSCHKEIVCDPPPPPHQFSSDIAPHLNQTCALPDCHSAKPASAGLLLTPADSAYSNLVNRPSTEVPRLKRVEGFQPDSSYLLHKLTGTQKAVGGAGDQMPKGQPVDQTFIQKVNEWISLGAKKD